MEALNNNLILLGLIVGISTVIVLAGYFVFKTVTHTRRPKEPSDEAPNSQPEAGTIGKAA